MDEQELTPTDVYQWVALSLAHLWEIGSHLAALHGHEIDLHDASSHVPLFTSIRG